MKTLNIFKPGTHISNEGAVINFAEDLLVKSLAYNEQTGMEAEPTQVNANFADMVNSGAFKKMSASFYTPENPREPRPRRVLPAPRRILGRATPRHQGHA